MAHMLENQAFDWDPEKYNPRPPAFGPGVFKEMQNVGVLARMEASDGGEEKYALRLRSLRVVGFLGVHEPAPLYYAPDRACALSKWSKLELAQHLMSRGSFAIRDPARSEFLEARAQYEFEPDFSRPGAYFRALAMSPQIFARKGKLKRIYHLGLEAYYLALMRLEDLGVIAGLTKKQLQAMTTASLKDLLSGVGQDEATDEQEDPEDEPGIPRITEVERRVLRQGKPPLPDLAGLPDVTEKEDVVSKIPGLGTLRIHFDNWSHKSGNRRVYTTCQRHDNCRKWRFIHDFASDDDAVSWLLAWQADVVLFTKKWDNENHREHVPSKEQIALCKDHQYGGSAARKKK